MSEQTEATETSDVATETPAASEASEASGGARHSGREVALQVLYAIDLGSKSARLRAAVDPLPGSPSSLDRESEDPKNESPEHEPPEGGTEVPAASPLDVERIRADSERVFERVTEHFVVQRSAVAFARELVAAVVARSSELDELLGIHARNWRVSRMAAVDRNVLRLAVYELRDTQTPVAVVIDEAVDLARRFGSDSSPAFVNGVLDAVAREVRAA